MEPFRPLPRHSLAEQFRFYMALRFNMAAQLRFSMVEEQQHFASYSHFINFGNRINHHCLIFQHSQVDYMNILLGPGVHILHHHRQKAVVFRIFVHLVLGHTLHINFDNRHLREHIHLRFRNFQLGFNMHFGQAKEHILLISRHFSKGQTPLRYRHRQKDFF